jgi:hypothetical protein
MKEDYCCTYMDHVVCIWYGDQTPEWVQKLSKETPKNKIIFVPLDGSDDKYLYPERFIIQNREASLINHFLWEELLTDEEQDARLWTMVGEFVDKGKQYIIEDYEFTQDEPFYDYSSGRD